MSNVRKTILTDADGVLLDWEWAFNCWMGQHGFELAEGYQFEYDIGQRYGISKNQAHKLIRQFNESASIGFLPPLRDAMYYVKRLHEEHGYDFICVTSLSKNKDACELRKMNLRKLFGKSAFTGFTFLGTGADKDEALAKWKDSGMWWIEDKPANCIAGLNAGLKPILVEHGHNMDNTNPAITVCKNWKEIYTTIIERDKV
tara:strand:- start:544 stop:1146 length:603 start_codon:yes stop_codon:yes gene_type:complete